jgi:iron complex outermembrane receptor protein
MQESQVGPRHNIIARGLLSTAAFSVFVVLGAGAAHAQDAAASDAPTATATEAPPPNDPGEIIVTAQRRVERLQDVPISVDVVQGSTLQSQSIRNLEDLSGYVPNLNISKTPGADQIIMRGIGSGPGSPSLDQSVVMFIDGIYAGHSRQFTAPFLDIERLEVLRGPQGALVGRNTSAGAINIISRRPDDNFGGYLLGEYDFVLDAPKLEGAINVPLGGGFNARFAGKYQDSDGWVRNTINGRDEPARHERVGRLTLGYESGAFQAYLRGEVARVQVDGNPFEIVSAIADRPRDGTKETGSAYGPEFDNVDTQNVALNMSLELGGGLTLSSITGYSAYQSDQREDADFIEKDLAYATFQEHYRQWSQELRLQSATGGTFEWGVGAYYQDDHLNEERTTDVFTAPNSNSYRQFLQDERVWSFYGMATFRPLEQLWLVGSLRYTNERKHGQFALYGGSNVLAVGGAGTTFVRAIDQAFTEDQLDPSVSVQYRPNRNLMFYLSYLHGSKSGGFQGAISNALADSFRFSPETSRSFEGGMKLTLPGRGYFNLALFDTRYTNLQLSVAIQSGSTTSFAFYTGNAGEAAVQGVEFDGHYRFSPNFSLDGSFAWTPRARYTSYPAGPCYTGRPPTDPAARSCDLTGYRLGFAPRFVGTLTPLLTFPLQDDLRLTASGTLVYRSAAYNDPAGDPFSIQRSYAKLDARIAVGNDRWELALLGRNLTNVRTISFSGAAALAAIPGLGLAPDARQQGVDPPRTVAVQATFHF